MINQMYVITALSIINIALLIAILIINLRMYFKTKAQYTLFIIIFTSIFLLQYIINGTYVFAMTSLYVPDVSNHIIIIAALQTVAFSVLLWMQRQ